jgi:hypothetical protein
MRASQVQHLKDQGFDLSTAVPFEHAWDIKCSQCEAVVINGIPCHEQGCPNAVKFTFHEDNE